VKTGKIAILIEKKHYFDKEILGFQLSETGKQLKPVSEILGPPLPSA